VFPRHSAEVMFGDESQHTTFTFDRQPVRVRSHLNRVNSPAREPIHRAENVEWSDQIEFIDRRYNDNDNPAARLPATQTGLPGSHRVLTMRRAQARRKRKPRRCQISPDQCRKSTFVALLASAQ